MTKSLILTSLLCATMLYAGDTNTTLNVDKNITIAKATVKKLSKKQEGIKY